MSQPGRLPRIALLVPNVSAGGGVPSAAMFLHRIIVSSGIFEADLISVATSARDAASVRMLSPLSWFKGIRAIDGEWEGLSYRHFGALFTEFEFQRYQPRGLLTKLLDSYDLIQLVGGSPAWALIARNTISPTVLLVATLVRSERETRLAIDRGAVGAWRRVMTAISERLDFRALRHVDTAFVINHWMSAALREDGTCRDVVFAPPGVDTSVFYPCESRSDDFILSVARFGDPRKNIRLLFVAYSHIRQECRDAPRLVLAGKSAPTDEDWSLANSLGIRGYIEHRSDVSVKELAQLYRNASVFVLTSNEEGLGIVLLEAMASGTPVVSTRSGGPETVVEDAETGFLTPVGDSRALAGRVRQLLESSEMRRQMGAAGRRTIEAKYSHAVAGRVFLDKYEELITRRGQPCAE